MRNLAEQAPRLAELADLAIEVVTRDLDTRHESADIMGVVGGAMATAFALFASLSSPSVAQQAIFSVANGYAPSPSVQIQCNCVLPAARQRSP